VADPVQNLKPASDFEDTPKRPSSLGLRALVLLAAVMGAVFVLGAVFYIWLYVQQVQNGYRLASLQAEYEQLVTVQRKLRLEWSRFQDPHHLEQLGQKEFGLNPPRSEQKLSVP
jgi:cell division protein FtsB